MLPGGLSAQHLRFAYHSLFGVLCLFLIVNKFYTKYAHGFFFLDVIFPCPFIDRSEERRVGKECSEPV